MAHSLLVHQVKSDINHPRVSFRLQVTLFLLHKDHLGLDPLVPANSRSIHRLDVSYPLNRADRHDRQPALSSQTPRMSECKHELHHHIRTSDSMHGLRRLPSNKVVVGLVMDLDLDMGLPALYLCRRLRLLDRMGLLRLFNNQVSLILVCREDRRRLDYLPKVFLL